LVWEFFQEFAHDLRRGMEPALQAGGLVSILQVVMLGVLTRKGPQRLVDLSRLMNVPTSTLSELSDRLVTEGLVTRRPNPEDRRSVVLAVTASGRRTLAAVRAEGAAHVGRVLRRMDREVLDGLLRGVRGLRDAVAAERAESGAAADGSSPCL
jgi:DNA-binding MarR family transcriptional regulator